MSICKRTDVVKKVAVVSFLPFSRSDLCFVFLNVFCADSLDE